MSELQKRLADAKSAGRKAREDGATYAACPYPAGAIERSAWHQGWIEEDNALKAAAATWGAPAMKNSGRVDRYGQAIFVPDWNPAASAALV